MHVEINPRALILALLYFLALQPLVPGAGAQQQQMEDHSEDGDAELVTDESKAQYGGGPTPYGGRWLTLRDVFGESKTAALVQALWHGDSDAADALVNAGADVNAAGRRGLMPLHFLLVHERDEGVKLALKMRADPNRTSESGASPLDYAMRTKGWRCHLKAIVNAGADVQKASKENILKGGWSIEATVLNKPILARHGLEPSGTAECKGREFDSLWWLLDHGGDVNARAERGETMLSYAYQANSFEAAYILLERGENPLLKDFDGYTFVDWMRTHTVVGSDEAEANWLEKVQRKVEGMVEDQEVIDQAQEIDARFAKLVEQYRKSERGAAEERERARQAKNADAIIDGLEQQIQKAKKNSN